MKNSRIIFLLNLFLPFFLTGQIRYGSIEYEIKVNTEKRFETTVQSSQGASGRGGGRMRNMSDNKYLTEKATLYFNDTMSVFITEPLENMFEQNRTYLTSTRTNFNSNWMETEVNLFGEIFMVQDEVRNREWKFTNKVRKIAGKDAKQAITKINDSTTIYAWFDTDFFPSIGPESYRNLPGAILGLAYEDGSVTYFATKIEMNYPDMQNLWSPSKTKAIYIREKFEAEFGAKYKNHRFSKLITDLLHFY